MHPCSSVLSLLCWSSKYAPWNSGIRVLACEKFTFSGPTQDCQGWGSGTWGEQLSGEILMHAECENRSSRAMHPFWLTSTTDKLLGSDLHEGEISHKPWARDQTMIQSYLTFNQYMVNTQVILGGHPAHRNPWLKANPLETYVPQSPHSCIFSSPYTLDAVK